MAKDEKIQTSTRSALHLLFSFLAPYKLFVILALLFVCTDIYGLTAVPTELSAMINAATDLSGQSEIMVHALRMAVAIIAAAASDVLTTYFSVKTAARLSHDLRMAIYKKSLEFSSADFDNIGAASMITRTLSDINIIQQTYILIFSAVIIMPVLCAITIAKTYVINDDMGYMMLVFTLVLFVVASIAVVRTSPIFQSLQSYVDRINKRLRENILGVRVWSDPLKLVQAKC